MSASKASLGLMVSAAKGRNLEKDLKSLSLPQAALLEQCSMLTLFSAMILKMFPDGKMS